MRDTYDVILAVVAALGLGVFCGMPLHASRVPPATTAPSSLRGQQAKGGTMRGLVVVAQGRAVAKNKAQ